MEIVQIYESYKKMNRKLEEYLQNWVENQVEIEAFNFQEILNDTKEELERLLDNITDKMEKTEEEQNIKDLKYLMMDTMFLVMDLLHLSNYNEMGRCKMRAINYLGKRRRGEAELDMR